MSESWSREEVEATVSDYFDMLASELRQEAFNKSEHRRQLLPLLDARSVGAVEWKHQNISAVLVELGCPYLQGYKPGFNYQQLLADVVRERLDGDVLLRRTLVESAEESAGEAVIEDYLVRLEDPPEPHTGDAQQAREDGACLVRPRKGTDYLAREARNGSLGKAGELFVLGYERARLARLGADALVDRVEHVAVTQGDGLGFDIRSFRADGSDKMIEVKTTAYGKYVPFFVSANELAVSRAHADQYSLYRVFGFRTNPRLFVLEGAIDQQCMLQPIQYSARAG